MRWPTFLAVGVLSLASLAFAAGGRPQPQEPRRTPDFVGRPVLPIATRPARAVPPAPDTRGVTARPSNPRRTYPRPGSAFVPRQAPVPAIDPLLAPQAALDPRSAVRTVTTSLNQVGQAYSAIEPSDAIGAVGPAHYVQMINGWNGTRVTMYDKITGAVVTGPFLLESLRASDPADPCAQGAGDPVPLYDRLADRWLLSEFAASGNHLCVYVSQTNDPAGTYWGYDFETPDFPDYPKYSAWPGAYFVTTNEPTVGIYALDRGAMLTGGAATFQRFTVASLAGFGFQALTPGDFDGAIAPPAGSPAPFVRHRDDEAHDAGANDATRDFLDLWQLRPDFVTPANSVLSGPTSIGVASFDSHMCEFGSMNCVPQPGTVTLLDPLTEVVLWRVQYRNFGTHETLVGNFTVDVDGTDRAGIRWFELRKAGAGAWALHQEGTWSPDATNRWMGSLAMDRRGNILLGYNVSSSTVYPGLRFTGRQASDPPGTMTEAETSIVAGLASNLYSNRWGDYSAMTVDPSDNCTFWYTAQYSPATSWGTRIATLTFDACGATPWTDDPLVPGVTPVHGAHVAELRTRIAALRVRFGLSPVVWTDPAIASSATLVKAAHIAELRSALQQVYAAASIPAPVYTDPALTIGVTPVKAAHISELRAAVVAIE